MNDNRWDVAKRWTYLWIWTCFAISFWVVCFFVLQNYRRRRTWIRMIKCKNKRTLAKMKKTKQLTNVSCRHLIVLSHILAVQKNSLRGNVNTNLQYSKVRFRAFLNCISSPSYNVWTCVLFIGLIILTIILLCTGLKKHRNSNTNRSDNWGARHNSDNTK